MNYPLRSSSLRSLRYPPSGGPHSAVLGCVRTNCVDHPSGGHDYWAIDLIADEGDPVHAAGGGILHIGTISYGCTAEGERGGTWLWIDHGGGIVSRYHHLSAIDESLEGRFVGPATKIGEVGRSGNYCGIEPYYLHFEVRRGGIHGRHVRFDQLHACRPYDGRPMRLPADMDGRYATWDDVPYRGPGIPASNASCFDARLAEVPPAPSVNANSGNRRAVLSWTPPTAETDGMVIESRIFRPSSGQFSQAMYEYLDGTPSSRVVAGLTNGRRYRYRIAFHGLHGYSDWSGMHEVVPAGLPSQPHVRRLVTTRTRIGFGWTQSEGNGRPLDSYLLAIRRETRSGWAAWRYTAHSPDSTTFNWYDLEPDARYQVRVRGRSSVGASPWARQTTRTEA